ncbi:hypothetical protein IAT40_000477 [Kwoniella sp. CBS 6097]
MSDIESKPITQPSSAAPPDKEAAPSDTEAAPSDTEAALSNTEAAPSNTEAAPSNTEAAPSVRTGASRQTALSDADAEHFFRAPKPAGGICCDCLTRGGPTPGSLQANLSSAQSCPGHHWLTGGWGKRKHGEL